MPQRNNLTLWQRLNKPLWRQPSCADCNVIYFETLASGQIVFRPKGKNRPGYLVTAEQAAALKQSLQGMLALNLAFVWLWALVYAVTKSFILMIAAIVVFNMALNSHMMRLVKDAPKIGPQNQGLKGGSDESKTQG